MRTVRAFLRWLRCRLLGHRFTELHRRWIRVSNEHYRRRGICRWCGVMRMMEYTRERLPKAVAKRHPPREENLL